MHVLAHHSPSVTTHEEWPLLPFGVWFTPRLPSHSTFHSLISHFALQSFPPLFGPIIFVCALLLLLSLCCSPFIYSIIFHLHSLSFPFMLLSRLMHMLLSLWNVFYPWPSLVCFCHHKAQLPSGLSVLQCQPTDKLQLHLIINTVVSQRYRLEIQKGRGGGEKNKAM